MCVRERETERCTSRYYKETLQLLMNFWKRKEMNKKDVANFEVILKEVTEVS